MSEIHDFLLHMSEDEQTLLFQMPFGQKVLEVLMAFVISMSIIMKLFIYYNIGQDKWKERPINILIIIDQVIQHFFNTVIGIGMVVKVTF